MITMYGIPNCDTIKKARKWLEANQIEYRFHDYRKDGLDETQLKNWVSELGWETLLNKRGTTWRQQPEEIKDTINEASAISLMLEYPAMIKRPLIDTGSVRLVGFKDTEYSALFDI
ncbi:ArsC family reductase [Neptuniibacter sp. 2_MG-2023]|uniref:ArsC family reductase n=1 Tax=Neptuniibacter sp. 2_MG-2023 TaxID=3062671 RepID=UPI0026E18628|nr:ArsC family reductase [Neptuniibacter sp. 2_MG-2023]MDO6515045.1 ArsC family reductase [Neptuniibacter sp. 2_MG-2023]